MLSAKQQRLNVTIRLLPDDIEFLRLLAFKEGKNPCRLAQGVVEGYLNDEREKRVKAQLDQS